MEGLIADPVEHGAEKENLSQDWVRRKSGRGYSKFEIVQTGLFVYLGFMNKKHDRSKVLDIGLGMICARGFSQLGVDEICERTGMTKGAFYNAFKSKENFLILGLESYGDSTVARITETLAPKGNMSAIERLEAFYVGMLTYQPEINFMGCMINNIMSELGGTNEQVASTTSVQFESFIQALIPTVKAAQAEGALDPEVDPRGLAELMHSTFYGTLTRARGLRASEQGVQTMQLLLKALKPHD